MSKEVELQTFGMSASVLLLENHALYLFVGKNVGRTRSDLITDLTTALYKQLQFRP